MIQPALVPICFIAAWSIVIATLLTIWSAMRDGVVRARVMHQVPCSECQFFTRDYHLKCPVHPREALTEAAINCPDYEH